MEYNASTRLSFKVFALTNSFDFLMVILSKDQRRGFTEYAFVVHEPVENLPASIAILQISAVSATSL